MFTLILYSGLRGLGKAISNKQELSFFFYFLSLFLSTERKLITHVLGPVLFMTTNSL